MGILSVGDLAHADLKSMEMSFGILGNQLYFHAHGIDLSNVEDPIPQGQTSYGKSQMLLRDYILIAEIRVIMLEMIEDIARRARDAGKAARTISLGIRYSKNAAGGSFHS
ncbi:hypothetical protein [Sporosarcina limicola]|uniref:Nucleotidyltransferase/DNA polymerase involved in DNA repair n=1 Tax=Sporosarcina limicola TaxID=34101 RepID=A0A927MPW9_9BACL|nr:hypothetical protein [Sporosarcina limicola]MBE1557107.1 nucleotidyltransferase/DNA polymerase involved in DNA repair [Sporosarcina limicola]